MRVVVGCLAALWAQPALANLDAIGVTALRQFEPGLTGSGVCVAQVEAASPGWQTSPAAVGCPTTWTCGLGSTTNFPNSLGAESGHANDVARLFLNPVCGIAPGVAHLDNYDFQYFTGQIIPNEIPIAAKVVNQSFAYFGRNARVDQDYDDYAAKYNVLFVSGAGNSGRVRSPGTAYNGISVAAYGGQSSVGPASDGRSKPDLTAPGAFTSFSAPLVSGGAALLTQVGISDIRLLKALLLNGAQKPWDWTNSSASPLDHRYGAGVLNVFQSWRQFRGGQQPSATRITARRGWDLAAVSSNSVQRYHFDLRADRFTATLVWLRQYGCSNINNLDLSLFTAEGALLGRSASAVDNVEHLSISELVPAEYILEVSGAGSEETYALAFDFGPGTPPRFEGWTLVGEPNHPYVIQATIDWRNWTPVLTNTTSAAGTFQFIPSTDDPARFFRALELP